MIFFFCYYYYHRLTLKQPFNLFSAEFLNIYHLLIESKMKNGYVEIRIQIRKAAVKFL